MIVEARSTIVALWQMERKERKCRLAITTQKSIFLKHWHRVIATLRTPDAVSPRQYPSKNYRLAIATLRTPDARFAQSNIVVVRSQLYAPALRCRYVATTRLIVENDYVAAPLAPRFSVGYSLGS